MAKNRAGGVTFVIIRISEFGKKKGGVFIRRGGGVWYERDGILFLISIFHGLFISDIYVLRESGCIVSYCHLGALGDL